MIYCLLSTLVRGEDFDALEPLTVTFSAGSELYDRNTLTITILDDPSVEGLKNFTAEVISSSTVIPGVEATIYIMDNDSKCFTHT